MILRLVVPVLCFLLCMPDHDAYSQSRPEIFWGPDIDDQKGVSTLAVFGDNDDYFFTLQRSRKKRGGYTISKIDADSLDVVAKAPVLIPEINKIQPVLQNVITLEGSNYLITTTENPDLGKVFIYAFQVTSKGEINQVPVLLAAASAEALNHGGNFRTYVDKYRKHLTVIVPTEHIDGRNDKFEIRLFDPGLNLLRAKNLEVPHASERLNYVDAAIDSTGDVYVLASIRDTELEALNKDRNIGKDFSLLHYSWATESLNEKSLSLGLKWLYDVDLFINDKNNVQICGYYSNMVDLIMAGTFSVELEPSSGKLLNQGITPFDRDFRSQLRPASNATSETDVFELDYVFNNESGQSLLISEKTYTETTQSYNPATGSYSTIYVYNFDEVLVSCINPNSKIQFNAVIPKYQSSSAKKNSYTSYLATFHKDNAYLFYNDHERNAGLSIDKARGHRQLTSASQGQLVMLQIEPTGRLRKMPLFTATSMRASFVPSFVYQTDNSVILMAKSGYRTQYFKVILD